MCACVCVCILWNLLATFRKSNLMLGFYFITFYLTHFGKLALFLECMCVKIADLIYPSLLTVLHFDWNRQALTLLLLVPVSGPQKCARKSNNKPPEMDHLLRSINESNRIESNQPNYFVSYTMTLFCQTARINA